MLCVYFSSLSQMWICSRSNVTGPSRCKSTMVYSFCHFKPNWSCQDLQKGKKKSVYQRFTWQPPGLQYQFICEKIKWPERIRTEVDRWLKTEIALIINALRSSSPFFIPTYPTGVDCGYRSIHRLEEWGGGIRDSNPALIQLPLFP